MRNPRGSLQQSHRLTRGTNLNTRHSLWTVLQLLMWLLIMMDGMTIYRPPGGSKAELPAPRHSEDNTQAPAALPEPPHGSREDGTEGALGSSSPLANGTANGTHAKPPAAPQSVGSAAEHEPAAVPAATYDPSPRAAEPSWAAAGKMLLVDRPWREQLHAHAPKLAIWAVLEAFTLLEGVKQVRLGSTRRPSRFLPTSACRLVALVLRPCSLARPVYTFGGPRVGNAGWAAEYNRAVPDTWAIINHNVRGGEKCDKGEGLAWCLLLPHLCPTILPISKPWVGWG